MRITVQKKSRKVRHLSAARWTKFKESNVLMADGAKVYLSLGGLKENLRQLRLTRVVDCTKKTAGIPE